MILAIVISQTKGATVHYKKFYFYLKALTNLKKELKELMEKLITMTKNNLK